MAIQFNCVSCQKAIEVADEWSCRLVECPYCGDTVTAPGISQPPSKPLVPVATPIANDEGSALQQPHQSTPRAFASSDFELVQSRKRFDRLALAGLLFCLLSMGVFVWFVTRLVTEIVDRIGLDASPEQLQTFFEDAAQNQAGWLLKLMGLGWLAIGIWLVGAIVSVVAFVRNRKDPRGKLAFWALLLSAYFPLLMVLGLVLQPN